MAYLRAVLTMSEYMLVLFSKGIFFRIIPLPGVLRKARTGYMLAGVKINHLLFMDDLNFFGKYEKEVDSLISTFKVSD